MSRSFSHVAASGVVLSGANIGGDHADLNAQEARKHARSFHTGPGGPRDYATGTQPSSVAVADLNGDGQLDLAVTNESIDVVSVLFSACLP